MKNTKIQGFTFVELIVVSTILAILWAVWFVAYTGYISWARDANRIAQLASITDGLNVLTAQSALPLPEESVEVIIWWEAIAYQWYAGQNILDSIWLQQWGKDPKEDSFFTYYLDAKRSSFQLMAFLEEEGSTSFFNNETYANDYASRVPTVYGSKLWALTDQFNTPIQEITEIQETWSLNVSITSSIYKAHVTDDNVIEWTSSELIAISPETSCERIKEARWSTKSTYYTLDPLGDGVKYRIFCNMSWEIENLLIQDWEVWAWSTWDYDRYWAESESNRVISTTPLWINDVIWEANSTDTNLQDGWWSNSSLSTDSDKTYRLSVWIKRTGWSNTEWRIFFGPWGNIKNVSNDIETTNPYFFGGWDLPSLDTWYLMVGYIHPIWYSWTEIKWWVYSTDSITKTANISMDYVQVPWGNINRHRVYMHTIDNSSVRQQMYDPRYEEIPASKVGDVSDLLPVRVN